MAVLTNLSVPPVGGNNTLTLMPKLQYRFRVKFTFGSLINLAETEVVQLTNNVVSVGRPSLEFDGVTIDTYNSRIYMPGKHTWSAIDITFRDDIDGNVVKTLDRHLSKQVDMFSQSSSRSAGAFKFETLIQTLDGTNGPAATGTGAKSIVTDEWKLLGCHISGIRYGENVYSSSEPVQISVTLRYDNAIHSLTPNGTDLLSSVGTYTNPGGGNATGNAVGRFDLSSVPDITGGP